MNEYYLHLQTVQTGERRWEKVDQFTWENWANAITSEGQPRYSGKRIARINGSISVNVDEVTEAEMGIICRILCVKTDVTTSVREGFYRTPEYVKFLKGRNKTTVLHEMNGATYRLNAA